MMAYRVETIFFPDRQGHAPPGEIVAVLASERITKYDWSEETPDPVSGWYVTALLRMA